MPVDKLFTPGADLDLDLDTSVGGVVQQQSYITPKSSDILEQTGRTIGTLRTEARNAQLKNAYINARWVVGKALVGGTEVWYQEDFSDRIISSNRVTSRTRERARQVVVLSEGGVEGVEKIFLDGEELTQFYSIGQYGDYYNTPSGGFVIDGSTAGRIIGVDENPTDNRVYALAVIDFPRGEQLWLGIINPTTMQWEQIGRVNYATSVSVNNGGMAFDSDGNLYGICNARFYKINHALPEDNTGDFGYKGNLSSIAARSVDGFVIDNDGVGHTLQMRYGSYEVYSFNLATPNNTSDAFGLSGAGLMPTNDQFRTYYGSMAYDRGAGEFVFLCSYIQQEDFGDYDFLWGDAKYMMIRQSTLAGIYDMGVYGHSSWRGSEEFPIRDLPGVYPGRGVMAGLDGVRPDYRIFNEFCITSNGYFILLRDTSNLNYLYNAADLTDRSPINFARPDILPERSSITFEGYYKRAASSQPSRPVLSIRLFYDGINNTFDRSFFEFEDNEQKDIGAWTYDCILKGKCCALIEYEQAEFSSGAVFWESFPKIEFLVKGLRLKVPDKAVLEWSDNAAAVRRWWLENRRGIPAGGIDEQSYKAAFDICEAEVVNVLTDREREEGYPLTAKRYTSNGLIFASDDPVAVEDELNFCWAGNVVLGGDGKYLFKPGSTTPIVADITEADIITRGAVQLTEARQKKVNSVSMELAQNEHRNYLPADIPPYDDLALIQRDGEVLPLDYGKRAFITSPATANRLLAQQLRLNRLVRRWAYKLSPREDFSLMGLLPGDRVTIEDSVNGLSRLKCVVLSININSDYTLNITLAESPDGIYADTGVNPTLQRNLRVEENRTFAWPYRDSESAYFQIDEARVTIGQDVFTTSSAYDRLDADDLVQVEILNTGGFVSITPGTEAPPDTLPDVVLPTLTINPIPAGLEGSQVVISVNIFNGNFDRITFDWEVSGGVLDDSTAPSPLLTRPDVSTRTEYTARLSVLVEGLGIRFKPFSEVIEVEEVKYIVENTPVTAPTTAPPNLKEEQVTEKSILWDWDSVPSATSYEYRFAEGSSIPARQDWVRVEASPTPSQVTLTGLKHNTEYTIEVRGRNRAGAGPSSLDSAVTSDLPVEMDGPPTVAIVSSTLRRTGGVFVSVSRAVDTAYYMTIQAAGQRDFAEDDEDFPLYTTYTTRPATLPVGSLPNAAVEEARATGLYVRARLTTAANDGGEQGGWSNIVFINRLI